MRNQSFATVTGSSGVLLGPNPRRIGLIVSSPMPLLSAEAYSISEATGADTSTTGIKLTVNSPNTAQWTLRSLAFRERSGVAVVMDVFLHHGADTPLIAEWTGSGSLPTQLTMVAGDFITCEVATPEVASVSDLVATWSQAQSPSRITLSFQGPAVLDKGITLYAGVAPLLLLYQDIGAAFQEQINVIADAGTQTIGVVELLSA